MDDVERVGLIHMLNIRGGLSESEYTNSEWLITEGMKLLESGKGIDTEYGRLFINEDIPFEEIFNGTTFPPYINDPDAFVMIEIGYGGLYEFLEIPCEDMAIKKALCRLGADDILDCRIEVDSSRDISDEQWEKICVVEKTKDIFGLNELLKIEGIQIKSEKPESVFKQEIARFLRENNYDFSENNGEFFVNLSGGGSVKIGDNDTIYSNCTFTEKSRAEYLELGRFVRGIYECCSDYEKSPELKADGLNEKYRCLAEFSQTVLAAKYSDKYGFEFVTWGRTFDGKSLWRGNYYSDYDAAKENFAVRSGLVDKDKLFGTEELEWLGKCVKFTVRHNGDLKFDDCEFLEKLNEKISENIPEQTQCDEPEISM